MIRCRALLGVLVTAAAAALALPGAALASGGSASITLTGGSLSFSTAPSASDFPSTALTGLQQTVHTNFATWAVNDARGSGAGWHVTFQASQFTGTGGSPPTLPTGSLSLSEPATMTPTVGNLALPPVVQCVPSCVLDGGSAASIAHALAATGQGTWTMTQTNLLGGDLAVTVPPSATADTYTSTLTFTLATGP
jgi:WxL domain surface cell wall-binding